MPAKIEDLVESREQRVIVGIVSDLRIINGQRGKLAIFKLDDKSVSIEATADEQLINANRNTLKDDELIIVQGKAQPDRFSGGLRFQVNAIWDLPTARAKFGKYLRVSVSEGVNGKAPDIARMVRDFPPKKEQTEQGELLRGLNVRLQLWRTATGAGGEGSDVSATGEVALDERAKFFPSDAALASWTAQAHAGEARVVYE